MTKQLLLGGILGGITLFAWLGLSWAKLPFHRAALHELPRKVYASTTGDDLKGPTAAVVTMQETGDFPNSVFYSGEPHKGSTGPEIPFMVWLPQGYPSMGGVMGKGLLLSILAAFLATVVVLAARQPNYKARVALCFTLGGVVALAGPMTFGNFFFFPLEWMLPDIFDQLIGWSLAGLVIAAFTRPTLPVLANQS